MKIDVKVKKDQADFSIKVAKKEFLSIIEDCVDNKIKNVEMDGFRKGKMPKAMFMKKYGYESVIPDAIDKVLQDATKKMVEENKLDVIDQFQIDWDKLVASVEDGFSVTGHVAIMPKLELTEYKDVYKDVKKPEAKVTKKAVKEEIDNLLKAKGIMELTNKAAKEGDEVVIDFVGSVDGVEFEGGSSQNYPLVLGSGAFIPGFEDQLVGSKSGDKVDVNVTFPENYGQEHLNGKDALFKVTVHEVKTLKVPKLTDELAKEIKEYDANTKEELEKEVEEKLLRAKEAQVKDEFTQKVLDKIAKINKVKVPKQIIDWRIEQEMQGLMQYAQQFGMPVEEFVKMMGQDIEEFKKEIEKNATKIETNNMIINAVIEAEKIKVNKADKDKIIKNFAKAQGITQKQAKEEFDKEFSDERALRNFEFQIQAQKAIDLLIGE